MTVLLIPDRDSEVHDYASIRAFLAARGVAFERWEASFPLPDDASQDEVLSAYRQRLDPYMAEHGYRTADVVVLHPGTPNLEAIRAKFLAEHTHSEDEVRFFVDGTGDFWFHLPPGAERGRAADEVFCVRCERGDLLSVPANTTHWFDCGEHPRVKAIRIFIDPAGWTPHYTGSGIERRYSKRADP